MLNGYQMNPNKVNHAKIYGLGCAKRASTLQPHNQFVKQISWPANHPLVVY